MITDKNQSLKLVLVTKGRSVQEVQKVLLHAQKVGKPLLRLAENRMEEAEEKFKTLENLGFSFEKHFIGKLQSRKIRELVRIFDVIQSVETLEQAQRLSKACERLGKKINVFIEVNLTKLPQRSGVNLKEAPLLIQEVKRLPCLHVQGLMGMASSDLKTARDSFKELKALQGDLEDCSMGMSSDYSIAIEEGSTMLRLGRVIFEEGLPKALRDLIV